MRDRCLEEFRRLRTETARLIRGTIDRQERIDKNLDLWIFALKLTEQSSDEGESENEGEEIGQNTGNGLQSTKCNSSFLTRDYSLLMKTLYL